GSFSPSPAFAQAFPSAALAQISAWSALSKPPMRMAFASSWSAGLEGPGVRRTALALGVFGGPGFFAIPASQYRQPTPVTGPRRLLVRSRNQLPQASKYRVLNRERVRDMA